MCNAPAVVYAKEKLLLLFLVVLIYLIHYVLATYKENIWRSNASNSNSSK
jgi:hypothetical protein